MEYSGHKQARQRRRGEREPARTNIQNGPVFWGRSPPASGKERGQLWLFFPGTGGTPGMYSELARRAARNGFHVINLAYPNVISVNFECAGTGDLNCPENIREEVLTGLDTYPDPIAVSPEESILGRLGGLLTHLISTYPEEGWDQFYSGGGMDWNFVYTGGHSQGGGHAVFVSKRWPVGRVVMFSSTEPAAWTQRPGVTPEDRYIGFVHASEPLAPPITNSWNVLNVPGVLTSVDGGQIPFGGSQRLTTDRTDCRGNLAPENNLHNCPCVDDHVPLDMRGEPAFGTLWDYLLTGE